MLEELMQYVDSAFKRAVDVAAYLQKINILFIELTKAGASADVLHSRTLSQVFGRISDGRHVGADRLDCTEWQKIGIKAAAWVDKRDDDESTLCLPFAPAIWRAHLYALQTHPLKAEPNWKSSRSCCWSSRISTKGSRASVCKDGIVRNVRSKKTQYMRLHLASRPPCWTTFNLLSNDDLFPAGFAFIPSLPKRMAILTSRRKGASTLHLRTKKSWVRFASRSVPKWQCGQMMGSTMCAKRNHCYVTSSCNKLETSVAGKCSVCGQLKKENSKSGNNEHSQRAVSRRNSH